jgi:hypothetical protein
MKKYSGKNHGVKFGPNIVCDCKFLILRTAAIPEQDRENWDGMACKESDDALIAAGATRFDKEVDYKRILPDKVVLLPATLVNCHVIDHNGKEFAILYSAGEEGQRDIARWLDVTILEHVEKTLGIPYKNLIWFQPKEGDCWPIGFATPSCQELSGCIMPYSHVHTTPLAVAIIAAETMETMRGSTK